MQPTHSSPQVCPLKPELQYMVPAHTSRWVSQAGGCREVARTFVLVSILPARRHLLHSSLSLWSSLSVLAELPKIEWSSRGKGTFPFQRSLPECQVLFGSFFLFLLFIPPSYMMIFLPILVLILWDFLPAFNKYFVRILPHGDVFLMYL